MRRYAALFLAGGLGENLEKSNRCFVTAENVIQDTVTYWTWDWVLEEIQKLETFSLINLRGCPSRALRPPQLPATVLYISPNSSKPNCNSRDEADNFLSNLAVSQVSRILSSPKFFYITRLEAPSIYRIRTIYLGNNANRIQNHSISSLLNSA